MRRMLIVTFYTCTGTCVRGTGASESMSLKVKGGEGCYESDNFGLNSGESFE